MASIAGLKRRIEPVKAACWYAVRAGILGRRVERPPVLIVGCGHSGTTLLLSILDRHPRIYGVPYEAKLGYADPDTLRTRVRSFEKLTVAHGKSRWVEKTPANVYKMGYLFEHLPGLSVVVMIRDGRDVVCSMKNRFRATLGSDEAALEHSISRWVEGNQAWFEYRGHSRLLTLRYEDLVREFDSTIQRVLAFLDEKWAPGVRAFHRNRKNFLHSQKIVAGQLITPDKVADLRNWQVHQPLFDGTGRWKTEMGEEDRRLFKERAGEMLVTLGYADDLDW